MKTIVKNDREFDTIMNDIYNKYREYGELQLDYGKPYKDKTLKQLGFFFGGLVDSVIDYYESLGEKWEVNDVKENFYSATSYLDESLRKTVKRFNGSEVQVPKRLSEMNLEEASLFIDRCIYLIDHAKNFKDLILRPELRYTWVRNLTKEKLYNLRFQQFPRVDKEYLEHTRKQACLWCGKTTGCEAHHLKVAGQTGTAYKADDWLCVPLCPECHRYYHQIGKDSFENDLRWITKYISLVDFCRIRYLKWKNKQ